MRRLWLCSGGCQALARGVGWCTLAGGASGMTRVHWQHQFQRCVSYREQKEVGDQRGC